MQVASMTAQVEGLDISCPADKNDEAPTEYSLATAPGTKRSIAKRDEREHLNLVSPQPIGKSVCALRLGDPKEIMTRRRCS